MPSPATLVADIRRNALDDGPGIRSTVFFKGCVLSCVWCQNPETLSPRPELQHKAGSCLGCRACVESCARGAVRFTDGARRHERARCEVCGACVETCPSGALRVVGSAHAPEQLVELLLLDEPFYRASGGGVTFSGGEPTLHLDYVVEVAARLKARGVHLLLETCGLYAAERFSARLLPHLDAIYFDLKLADPEAHRRFTGRGNRTIWRNLRELAARVPEKVLPRVPLVPEITATEENLRAICLELRAAGLTEVALLAYNPLWIAKREELGLDLPYRFSRFMTREELERCRSLVSDLGLRVR